MKNPKQALKDAAAMAREMHRLVDWRPYDLPEVYGPFENEEGDRG